MALPTSARSKASNVPTRHLYDVIVVGGQLGGALAAALLARRGYQVLHVEHEGAEADYDHGGWRLPTAPFLLPQLKSMPGVEAALAELGLSQPLGRLAHARTPALQLVLPTARVDVHEEPARRTRELTRAFGADSEALASRLSALSAQHETSDLFFREPRPLPPESWLERLQLKRQASALRGLEAPPAIQGEHPAEVLLEGLLPFATFLEGPWAPLARTRLLAQLSRGGTLLPGGREGLREQLTRRLTELGADVVGRSARRAGAGGAPGVRRRQAGGHQAPAQRAGLPRGAGPGGGRRRDPPAPPSRTARSSASWPRSWTPPPRAPSC